MTAGVGTALVDFINPIIVALLVAVARALGMIIITPAFTRFGLTGLLRSAVAIAISLPMIQPVMASIATGGALTNYALAGIIVKETLVGGLVGLVFGIPFWAADVAGDLVDLQRGSTMAQLLDPLSVGESSITATLFSICMIVLFFMSGGFTVLLDGYYRSYELWPVASLVPVVEAGSLIPILHILDRVMQIGVFLIAPIVIALLIADFMLAYLSRMATQLHIFDLSLSVKNMLFSLLMVLYMVFLLPLMLNGISDLGNMFDMLRTFLATGPPENALP